MAKKKSGRRGDFNMSAEVREILRANPKFTGREAMAALQEKFPNQAINKNSFGVAYSSGRKQLGLSKGRKKVRRRKPGATQPTATGGSLDMNTLQAARKYLAQVPNVDVAINAIKQLQALQIG